MSLFKSAATISALTLASRITGVIRDMLIARYFGATAATDAFYVAFRLPNMLRRLFAEGAFQQAFVPMLSDVHANSSPEAEKRFIDHVFTVLAAAVLFASVLGVLAAPLLVWLIASGLRETPEAFDLAAALTRVMFPYIAFMSLVALAASILNTLKKFAIPAATPILLNLSFIVCSVVLAPRLEEPIWALAAAVVLGGVLQLAAQILALARLGVFVRPRSLKESLGDSAVRRVLALMAPAVFGVGVAQLSILINTNIASWLGHGAVTWLNYADRLMEFPTALLGVALGTVLLPSLSSAYAKGNEVRYNALLDHGLRLVVLVGVPAAVGLWLTAELLVSFLFQGRSFTPTDVQSAMPSVSLDSSVSRSLRPPSMHVKTFAPRCAQRWLRSLLCRPLTSWWCRFLRMRAWRSPSVWGASSTAAFCFACCAAAAFIRRRRAGSRSGCAPLQLLHLWARRYGGDNRALTGRRSRGKCAGLASAQWWRVQPSSISDRFLLWGGVLENSAP